MANTDTFLDERRTPYHPISPVPISSPAMGAGSTSVSATFKGNGRCKRVKTTAGDIPAAAVYTITIYDQDGLQVYQQAAVSDNGDNNYNLTWNDLFLVASNVADYTITWSWAGSQTLGAGFFKTSVYLF